VKEYDKEMKQSVFQLADSAKLQLPADEKEALGLVQ
jgi:hypothetical protein